MRVCFIQYGQDIRHATMMVATAKKRGYEVWQLSDHVAEEVPGSDVILRTPKDEPSMLWRCRRLLEVETPFVMLDTDMLIVDDISLPGDWDAAVTYRRIHDVIVKGVGVVPMPYNGGLIFVNNRGFIRSCLDKMEAQEPRWQEWYGDQMALRDVVAEEKFDVKILRDPAWNYVPEHLGDTTPAKILHFKGQRKSMMQSYFEAL